MSKFWLAVWVSAALLWAAPGAGAQSTQPAGGAGDEEEDVVYRPPSQGASRARMGGGSRTGVKMPTIEALVPDHAGTTLSATPVLYWFCSEPTDLAAEFSLVDGNTLDTVKRVKLPGPIAAAGWQRVDLSQLGISLEPGVPYEWRVAVIAGTGKSSDNAVAGGMIQRLDGAAPPADGGGALKRAARLAADGVWYDALAAVMAEVEANPSDAAARRALAGLLSQVKLKAASAYAAERAR